MIEDLSKWTPRPRPSTDVFEGRFVRLEKLDANKHADGLFHSIFKEVAKELPQIENHYFDAEIIENELEDLKPVYKNWHENILVSLTYVVNRCANKCIVLFLLHTHPNLVLFTFC